VKVVVAWGGGTGRADLATRRSAGRRGNVLVPAVTAVTCTLFTGASQNAEGPSRKAMNLCTKLGKIGNSFSFSSLCDSVNDCPDGYCRTGEAFKNNRRTTVVCLFFLLSLPRTLSRAHKMTVATVIAGQVIHIRTTVEQPSLSLSLSLSPYFSLLCLCVIVLL